MSFETKQFAQALTDGAKEYPDRPALTCRDKTVTYGQLKLAADNCALKLLKAGFKKGDKAILWGFNGIEWMVAFFGITQAGGVASLMNYGLKGPDVSVLTKMVDASWGIIGGNTISIADPQAAAKVLIEGGVPVQHVFPATAFVEADAFAPVSAEDQKLLEEAAAKIDPKDSQVIIYTSGTTSLPKAVLQSSCSILSNAEGCIMMLGQDMGPSLCLALPTFHSYGLMVMHTYLSMGAHVHVTPLLKPDTLLNMICEHKITDMCSVGAIYGMLTSMPEFQEKLSGQLRFCIVGGGFTTPVEMMRFEKLLGGGKLLCGYGQTECSPVITVETPADPLERRAVSVGRSLPNHEVRIWNEGTGFADEGEVGEIIVKGPSLMNGYYGLPEEKQAIDKDGWLHTGDLGRFDPDGMLQFAGRIKDIIIRSGENITPIEIEKVLLEQPEVREAKVLGARHPIWGESVEACLSLKSPIDEDEFRARLKQRLASFKVPSHFFIYDSFPLNENGKLNQRALSADMLTRLYELNLTEAVNEGLRIMDLTVKNQRYTIVPACSMIQQLADQLGFDEENAERIRLSVEEMLTDRIDNAFEENGVIRMEVLLMAQWMRLRFTDTGRKYSLESEDASISARIILANVDIYSSGEDETGKTEYCLDYQYLNDFNVKDYLMKYRDRA
ncbi:MAG: AMP-binding protein [Lachnospiraceae bacterium]|nr:AMP-binding protein [Lachnospiraceae bacterium]